MPPRAKPAVSVILPFYNAAQSLDRAIASIHRQTFQDWEMIALDDGSTDASADIAGRWTGRDRRIRVVHAPHGGVVAALQRACAEARAPFLARMDADDVSAPERLQRQIAYMADRPGIAICGAWVRMTGSGIRSGRHRYESWLNSLASPEDITRDLFIECPLAHPAFFLRRTAFDAVQGYRDPGWPEDYDLLFRFWRAGFGLGIVPEVLIDWHEAPGRLSMRDPRYAPEAFRVVKRHYFLESGLVHGRRFWQWGAGEVGKPWLREWTAPKPEAVIDINPRKIGRQIHGIPVAPPEALPPPGNVFIAVVVGAPGARAEIRDWLNPRGYTETRDYRFFA